MSFLNFSTRKLAFFKVQITALSFVTHDCPCLIILPVVLELASGNLVYPIIHSRNYKVFFYSSNFPLFLSYLIYHWISWFYVLKNVSKQILFSLPPLSLLYSKLPKCILRTIVISWLILVEHHFRPLAIHSHDRSQNNLLNTSTLNMYKQMHPLRY